jgi:hypothetical protein
MENFLEEMLLIFPLLGLTVFEVPSQPPKPVPGKASPGTKPGPPDTTLYLRARGIKASGYDRSEGFVVLAGSEAVGDKKCMKSIAPSALDLRNSLVKRGVLVADADHFKFTKDHSLNSPSKAAAVVMGCSANGLKEWKDAQGRTLKAIRVALPPLQPPAPQTTQQAPAPTPPPAPPSPMSAQTQYAQRKQLADIFYNATTAKLSAGRVLSTAEKNALAPHLAVMTLPQLRALHTALGGKGSLTGDRIAHARVVRSILAGSPTPAAAVSTPTTTSKGR